MPARLGPNATKHMIPARRPVVGQAEFVSGESTGESVRSAGDALASGIGWEPHRRAFQTWGMKLIQTKHRDSELRFGPFVAFLVVLLVTTGPLGGLLHEWTGTYWSALGITFLGVVPFAWVLFKTLESRLTFVLTVFFGFIWVGLCWNWEPDVLFTRGLLFLVGSCIIGVFAPTIVRLLAHAYESRTRLQTRTGSERHEGATSTGDTNGKR